MAERGDCVCTWEKVPDQCAGLYLRDRNAECEWHGNESEFWKRVKAHARELAARYSPMNYDGPDPSVECAHEGCTNRLRESEYPGPQFCSREHREQYEQNDGTPGDQP